MRVLIDTDPGLGLRFADVDDGLAIFLMIHNSEKFQIEGITTVFGNTPVRKGYLLVYKYLKLANRMDIPYKKGATNKKELGRPNDAVNFLIKKVKENPKELTLITLGPLTNIASALRLYPEFLNNLKGHIMMGGTLSPITMFNPFYRHIDRRFFDKIKFKSITSEFNFNHDVDATKEIIEAKTSVPRVEMGLDVCCKAIFTKDHLIELKAHDHPITKFISMHIENWLKLWLMNGNHGFFPFDTFCPIYLLKPDLFKSAQLQLKVDTRIVPGKLSIVKEAKDSTPITYCTDFVDQNAKEQFINLLVSSLKF